MKKVIILALLASATWAIDFSQMSTEELMSMRGTVSVNERPAFRTEMQKRMQTMTPAQRQQFMQSSPGKGQGMGKGMNSQRGQGMGSNKKNKPTFTTYDLNNDGKITQKEFNDGQAKRMTQKSDEGNMMRNAGNAPTFESIDTNSDGVVTATEFNTHQTNRMNSNMRGKGQSRGAN